MDLSMAFDYVPHDPLLAKLTTHGFDNLILYMHSYLSNHKQCVSINITIEGPNLFNCFFNDFYYFLKNTNVHNCADENTLTAFAQNVQT